VHECVSDLDRHSAVHPPDLDRQSVGSAKTIFDQNILGAWCARVCPTETLCEEVCVREVAEGKAGADRPPAALRHRCRDGENKPILSAPRTDPADGLPWSAPAPARLAARTGSPVMAMT